MVFRKLCALVAVTGAIALASAPAYATDPLPRPVSGYCAAGVGVSVVVDFAQFKKEPVAGCAKGAQTNGVAALRAAGFRVQTFSSGGLVGVCRINDLPSPQVEKCDKTPPANAYWSYWQAPAGSWGFAQTGPMQSKPKAGVSEGWTFARGAASAQPAAAPTGPAALESQVTIQRNGAASGGPSWTLIGGIVVVVVLILAGVGTVLWRRRSAG